MNNRYFTLVVIGENPDEIIKPYDNNLEVEPYTLYEYKRAAEYQEAYKKYYEALYNLTPDDDSKKEYLKDTLDHLNEIDASDFYLELTEGKELDEETGDLIVTDNPNGRYDSAHIASDYSSWPLITKDGKEVYTALKSEVDWGKVHLDTSKVLVYNRTWEMVMEGKQPVNEEERSIYNNMKNRKTYFNFWGDKESYVNGACAFWGYAIVDQNGWEELEDNMSQIEWINNFYDRFIKDLPDDVRISIYTCFRK